MQVLLIDRLPNLEVFFCFFRRLPRPCSFLPWPVMAATCKGWMRKRGGFNTAWRARYFVLSDAGTLMYWSSPESTQAKGSFSVIGAVLVDAGPKADREIHIAPAGQTRTFYLQCKSAADQQRWLHAICAHINPAVAASPPHLVCKAADPLNGNTVVVVGGGGSGAMRVLLLIGRVGLQMAYKGLSCCWRSQLRVGPCVAHVLR